MCNFFGNSFFFMKNIFFIIFLAFSINIYSQTFDYKNQWIPVGPFYNNLEKDYKHVGRIESVYVNPNDTSEIFVGTATSGLWHTINGGKKWNCLTEDFSTGISDIAINPANPDEIFITTGIYVNGLQFSGFYGYGILKSEDKGNSWKIITYNTLPEDKTFFTQLIFQPENPNVIFALERNAVYKSEDTGKTWKKQKINITDSELQILHNITFKPSNPDIIIVSGKNTLFKTVNGGKKWTDIKNKFCKYYARISVDYGANDTLYAVSEEENLKSNYFKKSSDDGENWSEKKVQLNAKRYIMNILALENGLIFVSGIYLYKTDDFGNNFSQITGTMHVDIRDICLPDTSNSDLNYSATDGGIYKSVDGGKNWSNIVGNMNITQCFSVGICQKDTNFLITGAHDNGTYFYDSTNTWSHIFGGDGGTTIMNYDNPEISYYVYNSSSGTFALIRKKGKKTSRVLYSPTVCDNPVVQLINNPDVIYAVSSSDSVDGYKIKTEIIVKSDDGGLTIGNIYKPYAYDKWKISAMDVCNDFPDYFYYASFDSNTQIFKHIKRTTNDGRTWETLNDSYLQSIILKNRITDIEVHQSEPDKVWFTVSGFSDKSKVYFSKDGGANWLNISYNIENIPVNEIEYYKDKNLLIIGSDDGVYFLNDKENCWLEIGTRFPKIPVTDLEINYETEELYVSTYGRGIWKLNLKNEN